MKYPELTMRGKCPYCEKDLGLSTRFSGPTVIKVIGDIEEAVSYVYTEISCPNCKRNWVIRAYYKIESIDD